MQPMKPPYRIIMGGYNGPRFAVKLGGSTQSLKINGPLEG
jgi:hypothetical protein